MKKSYLKIPDVKDELLICEYKQHTYKLFIPKPFDNRKVKTTKWYNKYEEVLLEEINEKSKKKGLTINMNRDIEFIKKCIDDWKKNATSLNKLFFFIKMDLETEKEEIIAIFPIKFGSDLFIFETLFGYSKEYKSRDFNEIIMNFTKVLGLKDQVQFETLDKYFPNLIIREEDENYKHMKNKRIRYIFNKDEFLLNLLFGLGYFNTSPISYGDDNQTSISTLAKFILENYNGLIGNDLKYKIDLEQYASLKIFMVHMTRYFMRELLKTKYNGEILGHFYISNHFFYEKKESSNFTTDEILSYNILFFFLISSMSNMDIMDVTIINNPRIVHFLSIFHDKLYENIKYARFFDKIPQFNFGKTNDKEGNILTVNNEEQIKKKLDKMKISIISINPVIDKY